MARKIFSSGISQEKIWRKGVKTLTEQAREELQGNSCDLVLFFVSEGYSTLNPLLLSGMLSHELSCDLLMGCNASGAIGTDKEIEMQRGISLMAMHLPGVGIHPFSMSAFEVNSMSRSEELIQKMDLYPTDKPHFICLADSMSCDVESFLRIFNEAYPHRPMTGGLASGAAVGVPNWLILNKEVFEEGIVGVALTGEIDFEVIVSQGCRPVGEPLIITSAQDHILHGLASKPAFEILKGVVEKLSPEDKKLAQHSLFVGLAMEEQQHSFKRGDFLIRNIMGLDQKNGSLMIGASLRTGQTLQFHLRDARTSAEDLKVLLGGTTGKADSQGAILTSCCGRGKGLYGRPNHDVEMIQSIKGPLPLAGFFANGEIGPIGRKNYLHGYTSSLVIIR